MMEENTVYSPVFTILKSLISKVQGFGSATRLTERSRLDSLYLLRL